MFLEEEVYGMLYWGFGIVMFAQFLFMMYLLKVRRVDCRTFFYLIINIVLFTLAGYNLLGAIHTFEYQTGMGSEKASVSMAFAGLCWATSVWFLLGAKFRLSNSKS